MPHRIAILQSPAQAASLLDPQRLTMLEMLREPDSAAGLARRLQLPRQQVNYHLRALENANLVCLAGEARKGNCVERLMQATAESYLISPAVLGSMVPPLAEDRFSATYLAATAAQTITDLGQMQAAADRAGKRLATMTIATEVRFATPEARAAFAAEVAASLAAAVAKYHHETAPGGRKFKVFLGAYPAPKPRKTEIAA